MSKKTPTKADLERQVKQLQNELATAAKNVASMQTRIDQNAQDIRRHVSRIDNLKAHLDDAFEKMDIARVQRDQNAEATIAANKQLAEVRGELHRTVLHRDELKLVCKRLEHERDRARAALVEASINASRLVEAVEPRNMALACS